MSLSQSNLTKNIPKRNQIATSEGLLPGDIILLWRVHFGTFLTNSVYPKYFESTYGIDGPRHLANLIEAGYVIIDSARDSLKHLNMTQLKTLLTEVGAKYSSSIKRAELDQLVNAHFTDHQLDELVPVRGYRLTEKGEKTLSNNQAIVDRHPQKKF